MFNLCSYETTSFNVTELCPHSAKVSTSPKPRLLEQYYIIYNYLLINYSKMNCAFTKAAIDLYIKIVIY